MAQNTCELIELETTVCCTYAVNIIINLNQCCYDIKRFGYGDFKCSVTSLSDDTFTNNPSVFNTIILSDS